MHTFKVLLLTVLLVLPAAASDSAADRCQRAIKENANDPTSVRFIASPRVSPTHHKNHYQVLQCAYVKNAFGADVLNLWECAVEEKKDGHFKLWSLEAHPHTACPEK